MKLLTSIALLLCMPIYGQDIEVFGGLNTTFYHDNEDDSGHYRSSYNSGSGYSFGVAIDSIRFDKTRHIRLTLMYNKYSGGLTVSDGGLGGGYTTQADFEKQIISLGVYPLNLRDIKGFDINIGFEVSRLIQESINGIRKGWFAGENYSHILQDKQYSSTSTIALCARLAYSFKLNESILILPQYGFYYGLKGEFQEFQKGTKSIRNFIGVGMKMTLNRN